MDKEVSVDELIVENQALKAELAETKQKLSWLMEQISSTHRKLYGPSSEKSVYDGVVVQVSLFEESEPEIFISSALADEATPPKAKPKKRGEMGTRLPNNLPVEIIECTLPEDEQICPTHGAPLQVLGRELVRRELKFTPAKATIVEYWRSSYSCRACDTEGTEATIVKAPMPPQVIKGSMCAPETIAHIIAQKCVMGAPLYRQEQDWRRNGIPITRQTMANWLIRCSEEYFEPIYAELHRLLCLRQFLHVDETTFQVLREPGKPAQSKSQMWMYRTSGDTQHPIVLYDYQPDRKQERPREFLKNYSGFLMCDGYTAYHGLPDNIVVVGCFAHVRVKFSDALKCLKEEDRPGSLALIGKQYCNKLFDIEREIKDEDFVTRFQIRDEKAVPVLNEFHAWLERTGAYVAHKTKLGVAIGYALNQWPYLRRYLLDGRIEISNNRGERSIKPFVINRKNFLFATSVAGARAAAVLHSMTETAKENGLNPFSYLTYVLHSAAGGDIRHDADLVKRLLPENAPTTCLAIE